MSDAAPGSAEPDPRPRPAYGEYATPEEQQARIRQPDVTASFDSGQAPVAPAAPPLGSAPHAPQWGATPPLGSAPAASGVRRRPVDRAITFALLAFGAINVVFSAMSYVDLPALATRAMAILGIEGEFTNVESASFWGPAAAVVLVVGFVLTAVLAVRRVRRFKIAWWIPVVGGFVTYVAVYICLIIPLWGDPAFMEYVTSMS